MEHRLKEWPWILADPLQAKPEAFRAPRVLWQFMQAAADLRRMVIPARLDDRIPQAGIAAGEHDPAVARHGDERPEHADVAYGPRREGDHEPRQREAPLPARPTPRVPATQDNMNGQQDQWQKEHGRAVERGGRPQNSGQQRWPTIARACGPKEAANAGDGQQRGETLGHQGGRIEDSRPGDRPRDPGPKGSVRASPLKGPPGEEE